MALDKEFVKTALTKLTAHYAAADERRRHAMREMAEAQAAIKAIYALGTDEPLKFTGKLADACRVVLKDSPAGLTPIEARNAIVALGYELTKKHKSNPMASVHSVLKSFEKSKKARQVTLSAPPDAEGMQVDKVVYQWIGDEGPTGTMADFNHPILPSDDVLREILATFDSSIVQVSRGAAKMIAEFNTPETRNIIKQAADIAATMDQQWRPTKKRLKADGG